MVPDATVIRTEIRDVVVSKSNFDHAAMIKTEKRKRGRPKGSKNKNNKLTPPALPLGMKPLPLVNFEKEKY